MKTIYDVLRRPIVTEKSTKLKDNNNQIVFEVMQNASKYEIKNAVKFLFNVSPISVQTINCRGKQKRIGKNIGKKRNWKKAIINLKSETDVNALGVVTSISSSESGDVKE